MMQKKQRNSSVSAVSGGKSTDSEYPYRKCTECDRMHAGICWQANPDLAPKNWSDKGKRSVGKISKGQECLLGILVLRLQSN